MCTRVPFSHAWIFTLHVRAYHDSSRLLTCIHAYAHKTNPIHSETTKKNLDRKALKMWQICTIWGRSAAWRLTLAAAMLPTCPVWSCRRILARSTRVEHVSHREKTLEQTHHEAAYMDFPAHMCAPAWPPWWCAHHRVATCKGKHGWKSFFLGQGTYKVQRLSSL